jgi:hypothetical protein
MKKMTVALIALGALLALGVAFIAGYGYGSPMSVSYYETAERPEEAYGPTGNGYRYTTPPACNANGFCLSIVSMLGLLQELEGESQATTTAFVIPAPAVYLSPDYCVNWSSGSDFKSGPLFGPLEEMLIRDETLTRYHYMPEDFCGDLFADSTMFEVTNGEGTVVALLPLSSKRFESIAPERMAELGLDEKNDIVWHLQGGVICTTRDWWYRVPYSTDEHGNGWYADEAVLDRHEEKTADPC